MVFRIFNNLTLCVCFDMFGVSFVSFTVVPIVAIVVYMMLAIAFVFAIVKLLLMRDGVSHV